MALEGYQSFRFSHDGSAKSVYRRGAGPGVVIVHEVDSSRGNPHGIPRTAHSAVTNDLVDEARHPTRAVLERVLGFFAERLR